MNENGDPLQGIDLFIAAKQLVTYVTESVEASHCYYILLENTPETCEHIDRSTVYDPPGFRQNFSCTTEEDEFVVVSRNLSDSLSSNVGEFFCRDSDFVFHIKRRQHTQKK